MFLGWGAPVIPLHEMLAMYSLSSPWNVAMLAIAGGFLVGFLGFALGLVLGTPQPKKVGTRGGHHRHAA